MRCGIICALFFIAACNTKPVKPLAVLIPFKPSATDSIYANIRPTVQQFTVNNNAATTITASGGTSILIPAGCFLTAAGKIVKGNVQVELVEAKALKDFISGGLATVSNGQLLVSNGMLYINATAAGEQLQVDTANPLTVSMPTITSPAGFSMFTGSGTNWQPDRSMMKEPGYAFTLPLNVLYPLGKKSLYHCITYVGEKNEQYHTLDTAQLDVTGKKYENTCIATREFYNRHFLLLNMTHWMSYIQRGIETIKETYCENNKFDLTLYKEYFNYPNRSFKETDSIVKMLYVSYFKTNKKKLELFCDSVNKSLRQYYGNWTDTNYYFDFRKTSLEQQYMRILKNFPDPQAVEIYQFNNRGVDLNNPGAFTLLLQKGVAINEINEMLRYNFLRNQVIKELTVEEESRLAKKAIEKVYEATVFSVVKMGWINCDRFYDDPDAGKAEIIVRGNSETTLKYIDCSLVIPALNVRLSAWQKTDGTYTFTQKDGRYIKLPLGMPAVVVGTAIENNKLFFAAQKITIKDGVTVNLAIKPVTAASLSDSLQAAIKL